MFVNDDSIINYRERKYEDNNKEIKDSEREVGNVVYINVREKYNSVSNRENSIENKNDYIKNFGGGNYRNERGRLCAATPPLIIANRTPPPPSQKHHFTQKHQINFCIDDIHRADSQRRGVDIVL